MTGDPDDEPPMPPIDFTPFEHRAAVSIRDALDTFPDFNCWSVVSVNPGSVFFTVGIGGLDYVIRIEADDPR